MKRIRTRMFFIKFLEYRGAKLLGIHAFKEAKRLTDIYTKIDKKQNSTLTKQSFDALKNYTLDYCKLKREKAFSALIFSEKWAQKRCLSMLKFSIEQARTDLSFAEKANDLRQKENVLKSLRKNQSLAMS